VEPAYLLVPHFEVFALPLFEETSNTKSTPIWKYTRPCYPNVIFRIVAYALTHPMDIYCLRVSIEQKWKLRSFKVLKQSA